MEYSYYRDSRHHYLTIPCPEMENYQYRMLAANRMESLIPCSIRNVDGKRYLYYDITAKENMTEFFHGHGSAPQEIPRLLYSIADAGAILERYLLDCSRLLLGPEFVFYDYTRGEFSFIYYPEEPDEPTGPAFYEYLTDHADAQDKMLYYTLLRLISISANRTFVLEEGFLARALGRQRPQGQPLAAEQGMVSGSRDSDYQPGTAWMDGMAMAADGAGGAYSPYGQMRGYDSVGDHGMDRGRMDAAAPCSDEALEESENQEDSPQEAGHHSRHLILPVVLAVLFLAGAIALAFVRLYIPMNETYDLAAKAGMVGCLAGSILTAVYGAYRGLRSSRQELHSVREHARWEKRNALTPVDEFR